MKTFSIEQLEKLAVKFGCILEHNPPFFPKLSYGHYGFVATEGPETGMTGYCGFVFYGPAHKQKHPTIIQLFNELYYPDINNSLPLLTVELARNLINKKVITTYSDVNNGSLSFLIVGLKKTKDNFTLTHEPYYYRLLTKPIDQNGNLIPIEPTPKYYLKKKPINPNEYYIINDKVTRIAGNPPIEKIIKVFKTDNVVPVKNADITKYPELFVELADYEEFIYEWQGIFRVGSGAERLFVNKILPD